MILPSASNFAGDSVGGIVQEAYETDTTDTLLRTRRRQTLLDTWETEDTLLRF